MHCHYFRTNRLTVITKREVSTKYYNQSFEKISVIFKHKGFEKKTFSHNVSAVQHSWVRVSMW